MQKSWLQIKGRGCAVAGLLLASAVLPTYAAESGPGTGSSAGTVLQDTLSNGLKVVIVRDTLAPVVTTQVTYMAGSYEAPAGFPGTAHALEHMMFRDSKGMTGPQLDEIIGKLGAGFNAFTTNDATQFYFVAPAQYMNVLLHIEATRMRGALLTSSDWGVEKGAIEQEVSRDISSPDFLASQQVEKTLYRGTNYAYGALGSRPSFNKTTAPMLRKFYNEWYVPNNAVLVVAGDVDPRTTLATVKELFGAIKSGATPARAPVKLSPFSDLTIAKKTPDATGIVKYVFRAPGQQSPDYAAMQMLMDVLNNSRSDLSSLAADGRVLWAAAGQNSFAHGGIGVIEVGFPKGGNSVQASKYLDGAIERLLQHGVPADLVAAAKRGERAQFEFNKNSAQGLASSWSEALAWQGLSSPEAALNRLLAVTTADVDRVAREYIKPQQHLTVVLTPSHDGTHAPNSKGFGGTEKLAVKDNLHVALPSWAAASLGRLEMPKWTLDPTTMKLANGIMLIVQPEAVSKTVTVIGRIDSNHGLQTPHGQEGVGQLLDSLFSYGTTTMDRKAFGRALDEIGASESAGTRFSLAVLSEHFARGMQLLADNELHPALPEKAFVVQRKALAQTQAGVLSSPQHRLMHTFHKQLLPINDPSVRQATPASIDKLTAADVKQYFAYVYRPDMTTIVVVGDVTPNEAKTEVEKYFGAWKNSGPKPNVTLEPVPNNAASYTVVPDTYSDQDTVFIGQMMGLNLHSPERYALKLGNAVLGGDDFASRLMEDIRYKHGYAYGAGSAMTFDRSRSTFRVAYASDPDKVQSVNKIIMDNVREMRTTPISQAELNNAKEALIRSIALDVSSVYSIGQSLLSWSIDGEPLDEPMVAAKHYLEITPVQITDVFKKYVHPSQFVEVIKGPAPQKH